MQKHVSSGLLGPTGTLRKSHLVKLSPVHIFRSPFPACYGDVIAYDRPLTDSEVENLYTSAIWKQWRIKFENFWLDIDIKQ